MSSCWFDISLSKTCCLHQPEPTPIKQNDTKMWCLDLWDSFSVLTKGKNYVTYYFNQRLFGFGSLSVKYITNNTFEHPFRHTHTYITHLMFGSLLWPVGDKSVEVLCPFTLSSHYSAAKTYFPPSWVKWNIKICLMIRNMYAWQIYQKTKKSRNAVYGLLHVCLFCLSVPAFPTQRLSPS